MVSNGYRVVIELGIAGRRETVQLKYMYLFQQMEGDICVGVISKSTRDRNRLHCDLWDVAETKDG